jgi:MFS family permease
VKNHATPTIGTGGRSANLPMIVTLAVCYAFAMLDRQILAVVTGPLKSDLAIDDFELGLLLGPAFAISYIVFGVPFGWLSDHWSRKKTIALGLVVWTGGTIASGFVASFAALFATRAVTGAGEAALVPSSHALIAQSTPREKLAKGLAVFGWGASIGIGASSVLGGLALQWLEAGNQLPFLTDRTPWQGVFILAGIPGIFITLAVLRIRENKPRSVAAVHPDGVDAGERSKLLLPFLKRRWLFITSHFLAFGINNMLVYTVLVWTLPFLGRNFGYSVSHAGTAFGIVTIIGPVAGSFALSALVDRLFARGIIDAHLRLFVWAIAVGNPVLVLGYWLGNEWLFWIGLGIQLFTLNAYFAIGAAALQLVTPDKLRARMSAMLVSFVNITGAVIGPPLIGWIIQYVFRDPSRLGDALALMVAAGMLLCLPLAWIARNEMRRIMTDPNS